MEKEFCGTEFRQQLWNRGKAKSYDNNFDRLTTVACNIKEAPLKLK